MAQWEVLDISSIQSSLNYDDIINSDIDGVVLKLGYRNCNTAALIKDKELDTHYDALHGKIKLGYYWVSQAINEQEAIEEAEFCHQILDGRQNDFPVYFYSGWGNESHNGRGDFINKHIRMRIVYAWAYKMIDLGYRAGVYADDTWYRSQLLVSYLYDAGFSIWVSKFSPYGPTYSTSFDGWNYTDEGIKGDNTFLNLSYFYTNVADWPADSRIDLNDLGGSLNPSTVTYTGSELTPTPIIEDLVIGEDFLVTYYNNTNSGIGICSCEGINDFYGVLNLTFKIEPKSLEDNYVIDLAKHSYDYTNTYIIPEYSIEGLTAGIDYTIKCENNLNPGEATIYATGKGNYTGTISANYIIFINEDMESKTLILTPEQNVYTGEPVEPMVTIFGLTIGADYTVSYANNINVGTATVTATGVGRYTGSKTQEFEIERCHIGAKCSYIVLDDYYYTGDPITPDVVIEGLVEGVDYRVEYKDNVEVGYGDVILYGLGNYFGDYHKYFRILPKPIDDYPITITPSINEYTGEPVKPKITVEGLVEDVDFIVAYKDNIERGEHAIGMAIGVGNYGSAAVDYFTIVKGRMENKHILFDPMTSIYTGRPITPTPIIKGLVIGIDFNIAYDNNINVGTADGIATGINNYEGSVTGHFNIIGQPIDHRPLILSSTTFIYDGTEKKPSGVINGLVEGVDFVIQYIDNIDAGIAIARAVGIGMYGGSTESQFLIEPASIEGLIVNVSPNVYIYNGSARIPNIIIRGLIEDVDYEAEFINNVNAGIATVICTGIANYRGSISTAFIIKPKSIIGTDFTIYPTIFDYDGTPKFPEVTTSSLLIEDRDYRVEYINNTNAGVAFANIVGINNYTDTIENPFTIKPIRIDTGDYHIEDIPDQYYNGENKPEVIIEGLIEGDDFAVTYLNNTTIGTAKAIAIGKNNYGGTLEKEFNILRTSIRQTTVKLGTPTIYSKYRIDGPIIITYNDTTLVENTDYTLTSRIEEDFGDFTLVTFNGKGIGNFTDERTYRFRVIPSDPGPGPIYPEYYDADDGTNIDSHGRRKGEDLDYTDDELIDINTVGMFIKDTSKYYDFGRPCTVEFESALVEGEDFESHYSNNIDAGIAEVYVLGLNDYTGKRDFVFSIERRPINGNIIIDCGDPDAHGHYDITNRKIYYNNERELIRDVEFTDIIDYQTDPESGIIYAVITVTGIGNFTGAYTTPINVDSKKDYVDYYQFSTPDSEYQYTGSCIEPIPKTNILVYGLDYIVSSYENNINVGTATINIEGIGNYKGTTTTEFEIVPAYINDCTIEIGEIVDEDYDHDSVVVKMPDGTILEKDVDVEIGIVDYYIGTLKVSSITVVGINNYTGTAERSFYLNDDYLDINNSDLHLLLTDYEYTGSAIYPIVLSDMLIQGLDYEIVYDDYAIISGTYRVTVNGLGNYRESTKLLDFNIHGMDLDKCTVTCGSPNEYGFYDIKNFKITNPYGVELVENEDYTLEKLITANFVDYLKDCVFFVDGINNYSGSYQYAYHVGELDNSDIPNNPSIVEDIHPRLPINLINTPVYARSTSLQYDSILNGVYMIFDDIIENDRIRIVKSKYAFETPCMMTGWVDLEHVIVVDALFKVNEKVLVTGTLYQYESGKGITIEKDNEEMYVVYYNEDSENCKYGLSSKFYTAIEWYCNEDVLKHAPL